MQYRNKRENTIQRIEDAFVALYAKKDISQITVRMICEEAGINRSTFYTYFSDVYELRSKKQRDIISEVYGKVLHKAVEQGSFDLNELVRGMIEYIKANNGAPLLFIKRGDPELVDMLFSVFLNRMENQGSSFTENQKSDILMCMRYHINGVIALLDQNTVDITDAEIDIFVEKVVALANEGPIKVLQKQIPHR